MDMSVASTDRTIIVYDGECPFCTAFVQMVRLKRTLGRIDLIDARSDAAVVAEIKRLGFDLNAGMVVKHGSTYYHGSEAIHWLSLMSTSSGLFNYAISVAFKNARISRMIYPILRCGRDLTLRMLGRKRITAA